MKKCSKCGESKSLLDFYKNKSRKDGFHHTCIKCESIRLEANNGHRKYLQYINGAKVRNYVFELSQDQFNELRLNECYYCGDNGSNGLDRVDNTIGYTVDNVVACCGKCNKAKHALTLDEFLSLIEKVYINRIGG